MYCTFEGTRSKKYMIRTAYFKVHGAKQLIRTAY